MHSFRLTDRHFELNEYFNVNCVLSLLNFVNFDYSRFEISRAYGFDELVEIALINWSSRKRPHECFGFEKKN